MLHVTAEELNRQINGARVDKIYMPARDEALFQLRTRDGVHKLLISARPGSARVHLTKAEFEYPSVPPSFCMLLRKHLGGGRITGVQCVDSERVLFIDFEAVNELGDRVPVRISVELMGRYSNMVLIDSTGKIIDAFKRIDEEMSELRQILPGTDFILPPPQEGRVPLLSTDPGIIADLVTAKSSRLSSAILSTVAGAGPALCREIAFRTVSGDPEADTLTEIEKKLLADNLRYVISCATAGGDRFNIVYDGEKPVEFSFIPMTQYGGLRTEEFGTAGELFDRYYSEKDLEARKKARSHDLRRQVSTVLERTVRRQQSRAAELDNSEKADEKRLYGELLTAHGGTVKKGDKNAKVLNYYTNEETTIPLDPKLTPNQNAQKYYKEYRKLTTARKMLGKLIEEGAAEIEYLSSVLYEIDLAKTEEDFIWIRSELRDAGYLKAYKMPKGKIRKPEETILYRTEDGYDIIVGRNNAANDRLTLKTADKRDLWFHVKNAPGSHVILCTQGGEPGEEAMTQAAVIAAVHSSVSEGAQIPVDYTEVRNVRKTPGAKAGMVFYVKYKTAYVTPDPALAERLRVQKKP